MTQAHNYLWDVDIVELTPLYIYFTHTDTHAHINLYIISCDFKGVFD